MKKVFLWVWLLLKRQIKNPAVIIFLVGIPLSAAIIMNIPSMNESQFPRVGIVISEQDRISRDTIDKLINGDYAVDFYKAASYDELSEDVRTGKSVCGYVFNNNLTQKFKNKEYVNTIVQLQNGSDFIPSMVKEIIFSAIFSVYAEDIAVDYVKTNEIFSSKRERAEQLVKNSYEEYLNGTVTFHMKFSMLDDKNSSDIVAIEDKTGAFPLRGILGILVYLAGLFGCVQWKMDSEKGVFLTLPYEFRLASRPLYAMIPTVLFAVAAEVTLALTGAAVFPVEILKMFIYAVSIVLFSWLLGCVIPSSRGVVSVIPVLLIASLVLCPIFVNVTTYVPFARYLAHLLLPYYYI